MCTASRGPSSRKKMGAPYGLRSTCAIARVAMSRHSVQWRQRMKEYNISIVGDSFYVDDGWIFLFPIRSGWRWREGSRWWYKEWEMEDSILTEIERTKRAMMGSSLDSLVKSCFTIYASLTTKRLILTVTILPCFSKQLKTSAP